MCSDGGTHITIRARDILPNCSAPENECACTFSADHSLELHHITHAVEGPELDTVMCTSPEHGGVRATLAFPAVPQHAEAGAR